MPTARQLFRRAETRGQRQRAVTRALELNTEPANEILTTSEAKTWLRVDHSNDDTLIDSLVKLARTNAEAWLNRSFLDTTWDYWLDEFDPLLNEDVIELPRAPLSSITQVDSFDDDNNTTTFAASNYYAITGSEPGRIALVSGNDWPTDMREFASLRIRYVSGYASTIGSVDTQTADWIKYGVMLTVAALYENRGDANPGVLQGTTGLTKASMEILHPLRVLSL